MSPPRPPPNSATPSLFASPPPEFCLPLAPITKILPLFAPNPVSTVKASASSFQPPA
ncbi:hypothetical protein B0H17DRAFT_1210539 [Mycena rosella]|uniref:Uncharacterized protein n=1 Tax=Mycena rosella TaxID=1033263 RepID=A0AAD7G7A1_MYCRO|nr:hypothetical protein B0H17DRAFT_1210539 [Mycena rosella]